ncbi:MAG: sugar phosphate isomerase/epimerase [Kibdelosporangium sp.]
MLRGAAAAGVAVGAAAALPGTAAAAEDGGRFRLRIPREKISIQLYTLRSVLERDLEGTLSALADIGYRRVELAGTYGRSATEFRALLDKYHISASSSHVGLDGDVNKVIADAKILGNTKVVHPYSNFGQIAQWEALVVKLDAAGRAIKSAGLHAGYHNHDHEFRPIDGKRPWDLIVRGTDRRDFHLEIDLFWAVHGGQDPVDLVYANYGRVWQYHVKDRTPDGQMVDPGKGAIDFAQIFRRTWHEGIQEYIVEHDNPVDPLVTAKVGYDYLANLRF